MISYFIFFGLFFLAGSVPTAYLLGKALQGKDLRKLGSGNSGATNAFRVLGKKAGFFVFTADLLKGYLPLCIARPLFLGHENFVWITAAPVLGHIFTPFLGFKGGKGVATSAGVLLFLGTDLFIFSLGVWALIFSMFRIVSIASLLCSALLPVWAWMRGYSLNTILFLAALALLLFWSHRGNLERIFTHRESNFR